MPLLWGAGGVALEDLNPVACPLKILFYQLNRISQLPGTVRSESTLGCSWPPTLLFVYFGVVDPGLTGEPKMTPVPVFLRECWVPLSAFSMNADVMSAA